LFIIFFLTDRTRLNEAARFLGQVGGRQIDGDALGGELEAAILDRRPHPVLGFLDLRLRQANDGNRGALMELL